MRQEDLHNNFADESMSAEDSKVAALLGNLKRVGAPGDFDFHLKARIANAKPSTYRSTGILPIFRYAAPLVLLLLIGGFFLVNDMFDIEGGDVPSIVETQSITGPLQTEAVVAQTNSTSTDLPTNESGVRAIEAGIDEAITPTRKPRRPAVDNSIRVSAELPQGGSRDQTVRPSEVRILPPGFNAPESIANVRPTVSSSPVSVTVGEVMQMLGIEGSFQSSGYRIGTISTNSIAERAGIKSGDVIESINDTRINEKTVFAGVFGGKSVTVIRDGKPMTINLGAK